MFVVPTLDNGGAERMVARISNALIEKCVEVTIVIDYKTQSAYYINPKVKIISFIDGERSDYDKLGTFRKIKILRSIIRKEDPNIIVPFLDQVCVNSLLSAAFTKYFSRVFVTIRNNPKKGNKKSRFLRDFFYRFSKHCIVQNEGQKNYFYSHFRKKIVVIPNFLENEAFKNHNFSSLPQFRFVAIGRLNYQKNYSLMINGIKNSFFYNSIYLDIYGQGEDKELIRTLIGNDEHFRLCGFTADINSVLNEHDFFLLTSRYEGMPNSLAEAMAAGLICISSDCEYGITDIMGDDNVLLFENENLDELTKIINYSCENYVQLQNKAKELSKRLKNKYSKEVVIEKWLELISC